MGERTTDLGLEQFYLLKTDVQNKYFFIARFHPLVMAVKSEFHTPEISILSHRTELNNIYNLDVPKTQIISNFLFRNILCRLCAIQHVSLFQYTGVPRQQFSHLQPLLRVFYPH